MNETYISEAHDFVCICGNCDAYTEYPGGAGGVLGEGYRTISRCTNYGNITGQDVGRVGVRPCFYLNPESELSGDGSEDNPYKINDLTENEIKTVSAQKNGNVLNISADIVTNAEQFSVIFAVYDENGNVIAVKNILGASGKIDAQIDTGDIEAKTIKTFLWDSANDMKPLCRGNECTV